MGLGQQADDQRVTLVTLSRVIAVTRARERGK
jgi:hypothetical protein